MNLLGALREEMQRNRLSYRAEMKLATAQMAGRGNSYAGAMSCDAELIQIVDAATAAAAAKAGHWLACRPGCTQCCVGVFAISALDATRLREGLKALEQTDAARAAALRRRVQASVERIGGDFPGDADAGLLAEGEVDFEERFEAYANEEVCPVLDPATGLCDLYVARPMTCRTFGPPVPSAEGIAVCELCFVGAPTEEVERCTVELDAALELEETLREAEVQRGGFAGSTVIAFALREK